MREKTQLELPVVRDDELTSRSTREGLPNLVFILLECRLVLQIWSARGQASGLRVDVQAAVHTTLWPSHPIFLERKNEVREQRRRCIHRAQRIECRGGLEPGTPATECRVGTSECSLFLFAEDEWILAVDNACMCRVACIDVGRGIQSL